MVLLDANMVLRYLLNDNQQMADEAEQVIEQGNVQITIEVAAEVVYVLNRVYSVEQKIIAENLLGFMEKVQTVEPEEVLRLGLKTFGEQKLDFVDCILYAYNRVKGYEIKTFDKKLIRLLEKKD